MRPDEPRPIHRRRRGSRTLVILAVVALVSVASISSTLLWVRWSKGGSADKYARQACQDFHFAEPGSSTGSRSPFDASTVDDAIHQAQLAADSSASAAKRGSQWNSLAQAYSTLLADLSEYKRVLDDSPAASPSDMNQEWHNSYTSAVATLLVECRKATAK